MENPELDIQQFFFGHMEYIWDIHGEVIDIIHGSSDTQHFGNIDQWEFQDPKLEVPTIYFWPIFQA